MELPAMTATDLDLLGMSHPGLIREVLILRSTLRRLRDYTGHDLCWYNPEIWAALPEKKQPSPVKPPKPEFLAHCEWFYESLPCPTSTNCPISPLKSHSTADEASTPSSPGSSDASPPT
jgi:hypothetical protein